MKDISFFLFGFALCLYSCNTKEDKVLVDFKKSEMISEYDVLFDDFISPTNIVLVDSMLFFEEKTNNTFLCGVNIATKETQYFLNKGEGPYDTFNVIDLSSISDTTLQAFVDPEKVLLYNIYDLERNPKVRKLPKGQYAYNSALCFDDKLLYLGHVEESASNKYCLVDTNDSIMTFGEYPQDDNNIQNFPEEGITRILSYQGNGILNSNHNKAVFVFSVALGFEMLDLDNMDIYYKKYYQYPKTKIRHIPKLNIDKAEWDYESYRGFIDLCSTENYVLMLYSGKKLKEDYTNAKHILVYSWAGMPLKHFILPMDLTSITISKDGYYIYATTGEENARIVRFKINI